MINPATRDAARILAVRPGLFTGELLNTIPAAGTETVAALHRDGRTYGYGRTHGRWWLLHDNPSIRQCLAGEQLTPRHLEFNAQHEDRQWRRAG